MILLWCTSANSRIECIGYQNGPEAYSPRSNDVWSLGIILTSMISGHNPWKRAVMTDDCFRAFIRDPGFLRTMLPISISANDILQKIFVSPTRRLTLPKLRRMIVNIDTFFMSDDEIAQSSVYVQWAAASYMGLHPSTSGTGTPSVGLVINMPMGNNGQGRHKSAEEGKVGKGVVEKMRQSVPATCPEMHVVPLPRVHSHESHRTGFTESVASNLDNPAANDRKKRPAPSPQPMASFRGLMPEQACPEKKQRSILPFGFFKRIVDKVIVECSNPRTM